jgi:fructokinase
VSESGPAIGIDVGGTKSAAALVGRDGAVLARAVRPTPAEDQHATLETMVELARSVMIEGVVGVGIAAAGMVDLEGTMRYAPNLAWRDVPIARFVGSALGLPAVADNDVNAAAWGEFRYGAGRGTRHMLMITVGTGIGGGIAIDGRTHSGALHPEMGHIGVRRHARDGMFSGLCPFHGDCLEGLASGPAIVARYGAALGALPAEHEATSVVGFYLGQLAAAALLMLSPERIVFGGGVMNHAALLPEIRGAAATLLNGYAGIAADAAALDRIIVAPGLGERSGILGALALAEAALR